jgi:23S rRNA (adenine2503-C2)-methyltransferase
MAQNALIVPAPKDGGQNAIGLFADMTVVKKRRSLDGTVKLLLSVADGQHVEAVVLPHATRTSVCISSQVGCGRGCRFCVTATLGLSRSLSASEMVSQVTLARELCQRNHLPALRNVLYMGMGEPLDNLPAVAESVAQLTGRPGLALAPRHITVSTIGPSPDAIACAAELGVNLAWSLHTADDQVRSRLIPLYRYSLPELRTAFAETVCRKKKTLFVEVALIAGINDNVAQAAQMADFLEPLGTHVRVNLMALNPGRQGLAAPQDVQVESYRQMLRRAGLFCSIRAARGTDIGAACGQLSAQGY